VGLTGVVLGHFRLLSRCGRSIPCTGSPNTPPPSGFSPFKSVPLSLNAYSIRHWSTLNQHLARPDIQSSLVCCLWWRRSRAQPPLEKARERGYRTRERSYTAKGTGGERLPRAWLGQTRAASVSRRTLRCPQLYSKVPG